jgi:hypothetical protein
MMQAKELKLNLRQFTGSEQLYWHGFRQLQFTDGVKFLAENAEAYWLIDAIASYQQRLQNETFQLWLLIVGDHHEFIKPKPGKDCVLTCWQDRPVKGVTPLVSQQIVYTDFPLPEIKLYVEHRVLLLPSEH